MWQPLVPDDKRQKRDRRTLNVFGRLRDGASLAEARAELNAIAGRLAEQYPETNRGVEALVMPYNDRFNGGPIRLVFLALMGAVVFVLLIACANVANLLLARSAYRAREFAVRAALGASRWRVVRQLLAESLLLALGSGALGCLLSVAGVRLFATAVENVGEPYWIQFTMDWRVFTFLLGVSVGTSFVFGLAPALQASKLDVNATLQEGGRSGGAGARTRRFARAMVVVQLALTIVLLFGAGLMIRSFFKLYKLDLGVETDRLLTMRLGLAERKYPEPRDRLAFHDRLAELMAGVPGVESAAVASHLPLGGGYRRQLHRERFSRRSCSSAARRSPSRPSLA
jgi:putative ABC transport system permease protein